MGNPRVSNGNLRRKHRARLKALGEPCYLCGRPIDYSLPSTPNNPYSFVIDEVIPISRYWLGGYSSPRECAEDFNNLRAAHRICNAAKSNKILPQMLPRNRGPAENPTPKRYGKPISDGDW